MAAVADQTAVADSPWVVAGNHSVCSLFVEVADTVASSGLSIRPGFVLVVQDVLSLPHR